jgi:uncharacterized protein DUF1570
MKRYAALAGAFFAVLLIHTGVAAGSVATPARREPTKPATAPLLRSGDPALAKLLKDKRWQDALDRAEELLAEDPIDPDANEGAGDACVELDRNDDAALYFDTARRGYLAAQDERGAKSAQRKLQRIDPQGTAVRSYFSKLRNDLSKSALDLIEEGEYGMGAAILSRILPYAKDKDVAEFEALIEKHGGGGGAIDIDASGSGAADAGRKLIRQETAHYRIEANLEQEVVDLLGRTMDSIFDYYIDIYLDGDASRANFPKAKLRIYPSWEKMAEQWPGESPSPGLGGWWSPSENMVVSYDTRDRAGTLDELVGTLFHEASHQFMTFLSTRGGKSPAWLNEGTSSFFEGATAMKDGSVLWPDATLQRLRSLNHFLTKGGGPRVIEVLSFDEPGSYPGEYYCFGWGLIYFLMEYADEDLGRPFRPLYSEYRERMTSDGGVPNELFEEIFLGSRSPLGHETLDDFEKDWTRWILDEVKPLHMGALHRRREARMEQIDRFASAAQRIIDAADDGAGESGSRAAKKNDRTVDPLRNLSAEERADVQRYYGKALGHIVYIRQDIDDVEEDGADLELLEMEMQIVRALGRHGHEAILIARLLELFEAGRIEMTPEAAEDYEERLALLDKRNAALRLTKRRTAELVRLAKKIIGEYEELDPPMPKRAAGFAREVAEALDDPELLALANELGGAGTGGGQRALFSADGSRWTTILDRSKEQRFDAQRGSLTIESAAGSYAGRACADAAPAGDYELECVVERAAGAEGGLIISAGAEEWIMVGIDGDGALRVRSASDFEGEIEWSEWPPDDALEPAVAADEHPTLRVRVMRESGDIFIRVGERPEIETYWSGELPEALTTGVYSHGGRVIVRDAVLRDVATEEEE